MTGAWERCLHAVVLPREAGELQGAVHQLPLQSCRSCRHSCLSPGRPSECLDLPDLTVEEVAQQHLGSHSPCPDRQHSGSPGHRADYVSGTTVPRGICCHHLGADGCQ